MRQLGRYITSLRSRAEGPTISVNGVLHRQCLEMFYNPDPRSQIDNVETKAKIKVGEEWMEAPVHPITTKSKDRESSRPRANLTGEIMKKIKPPIVDNSKGDVVHIKFKSGRENTAFFASSTSKCHLLKKLYKSFEESKKDLEVLLQEIPVDVWKLDTLGGSKYFSLGASLRSGTQGSRKDLPFLRKECQYKLLMDISKIYAKLLGIEAAIIDKYCPKIYKRNHETYRDGEDCIFPSPQDQHASQTTSELFHFCLHQVALRILKNESNKKDEQMYRLALHTDDGDVSTDQPLTFLSFGGKDGLGGNVAGSDLVVFDHCNGGQCYRLKTSIKSTVVLVLFNSSEQLHGNYVDMHQKLNTSCWNVRFIPYGRVNVLNFISRRNENKVEGQCFKGVELQYHRPLKNEEFSCGDKVSAYWGKGQKRKLLGGEISSEDGQLFMHWYTDGKKSKLGKSASVYSFECSQSDPHDCNHCNPTGMKIVSSYKY
jgi:hypothetical protein